MFGVVTLIPSGRPAVVCREPFGPRPVYRNESVAHPHFLSYYIWGASSTLTLYRGSFALNCTHSIFGGCATVIKQPVMLGEQIPSEISLEVTPDAMNVVSIALGVVVFDKE